MKGNMRKVVAWLLSTGVAGSQRELALQLGYNPSSFSQIINGKVPLSDKFLGRITALEPRINAEWIRTGKGEMLLSAKAVVEAQLVDDGDEMEFYTENTTGAKFYKQGDKLYMTVKHVPYAAFGQFANDSDRLEANLDEWGEETYEVDKLIEESQTEVFNAVLGNMRNGYVDLGQAINMAMERLEWVQKTDGLTGVPSGFPALDAITRGWQDGNLIVIGARPGHGKSAIALNMAVAAAVDNNIPTAFFTLEMANSAAKRLWPQANAKERIRWRTMNGSCWNRPSRKS